MVFDSISSNIDQVLSINPYANVFVFGDFIVHHKDWLNYSGETDRSGELCFGFSTPNDLTQIFNFPTRIPDCGSHGPALLDLFLSSNTSFCSTMAFPPLGNSDHVVVFGDLNISVIRTGLPVLVELIDLVNSVIIFLSQTILLRWLFFLLRSQTVILTVLLFWIYLFLLTLVFVLQWLSLL